MPTSSQPPRIKLVVLDWAGTAVDHGSFAPVAPFLAAFKSRGVEITITQARAPMGLGKKEHLRAIALVTGARRRPGAGGARGRAGAGSRGARCARRVVRAAAARDDRNQESRASDRTY